MEHAGTQPAFGKINTCTKKIVQLSTARFYQALFMEFAAELRASLEEFLTGVTIEIREKDSRIAAVPPISWEVRGSEGKPLLHLWGEHGNVKRRVLACGPVRSPTGFGGRAIRAKQTGGVGNDSPGLYPRRQRAFAPGVLRATSPELGRTISR